MSGLAPGSSAGPLRAARLLRSGAARHPCPVLRSSLWGSSAPRGRAERSRLTRSLTRAPGRRWPERGCGRSRRAGTCGPGPAGRASPCQPGVVPFSVAPRNTRCTEPAAPVSNSSPASCSGCSSGRSTSVNTVLAYGTPERLRSFWSVFLG